MSASSPTPAKALTDRIREVCELDASNVILKQHIEQTYHAGRLDDLIPDGHIIAATVNDDGELLSIDTVPADLCRAVILRLAPVRPGGLLVECGRPGEDSWRSSFTRFPDCRAAEQFSRDHDPSPAGGEAK